MNVKRRIAAIDLLRALAVILMVEGHTVHVFLSADLRSNKIYDFWVWSRGFTAPLFMFVAGLIFSYLLTNENHKLNNERFLKGIKRGFFLIALGYALRFPSFNPFRMTNFTEKQINTFLSVDALHIIGIGIITTAIFTKLFEGKRLPPLYFLSSLLIFSLGGIIPNSNFINSLPVFFSAYFSYSNGSIFILFPWLGYLFLGATFSSLIKTENFAEQIKKIGILTSTIFLFSLLLRHFSGESYFLIMLERSSFVASLAIILLISTAKLKSVPDPVAILGKNSLLIYVAHLVILYGSPVSLGFYQLAPESLTLPQTVCAVLLIEAIMFYIAFLKEKNTLTIKPLKTRTGYAESE